MLFQAIANQFWVIAEDMQRCLCLVRTICSRSVQKVLADNFSFCIWAAFTCARLKSVPETRVDGFSKFFAEKGSATEKSSTAGKFDRVGSHYKIKLQIRNVLKALHPQKNEVETGNPAAWPIRKS